MIETIPSTIKQLPANRHFKHRGAWQTALKAQLIEKLSFPYIMSCNGRSKLNKIDGMKLLQNSPLYKHAGIVQVSCIEVLITPKNSLSYEALLSVNVYIAPFVTREAVNMFYDDLILTLSPYITDCFICACDDFTQATIHHLRVLGLHDIVKFTTRLDNKLYHLLGSN